MAHKVKLTLQLKRGTAARWLELNPILADGEPGWAIDTKVLKIGDGVTHWNDLTAYGGIIEIDEKLDENSTNPVQNKIVKLGLDSVQALADAAQSKADNALTVANKAGETAHSVNEKWDKDVLPKVEEVKTNMASTIERVDDFDTNLDEAIKRITALEQNSAGDGRIIWVTSNNVTGLISHSYDEICALMDNGKIPILDYAGHLWYPCGTIPVSGDIFVVYVGVNTNGNPAALIIRKNGKIKIYSESVSADDVAEISEELKALNIVFEDLSNKVDNLSDAASIASNAVLYTEQNLTDEQKAQARANIGVIVDAELSETSENPLQNKAVYGIVEAVATTLEKDLVPQLENHNHRLDALTAANKVENCIFNQTLQFDDYGSRYAFRYGYNPNGYLDIVGGRTYRILWDGVPYIAVSTISIQDLSKIVYINENLPFSIAASFSEDSAQQYVAISAPIGDTNTTHTITIYEMLSKSDLSLPVSYIKDDGKILKITDGAWELAEDSDDIVVDQELSNVTATSENPVSSKAVYNYIAGQQFGYDIYHLKERTTALENKGLIVVTLNEDGTASHNGTQLREHFNNGGSVVLDDYCIYNLYYASEDGNVSFLRLLDDSILCEIVIHQDGRYDRYELQMAAWDSVNNLVKEAFKKLLVITLDENGTAHGHAAGIYYYINNGGYVIAKLNDLIFTLMDVSEELARFYYIEDDGSFKVIAIDGDENWWYDTERQFVDINYLDQAVGDINTALDAIIAIQESLIASSASMTDGGD